MNRRIEQRMRVLLGAVAAMASALSMYGTSLGATCNVEFYPRVGSAASSPVERRGPGLLLMGGGTDVDAAFHWVGLTAAGSSSGSAGDLVVLRASGDNDYDKYIYGLAHFNSVRTILLPPCASGQDIARASAIVARAQSIFLAGGDQANYVRWKGGPLARAVQSVYDRGGIVGGTSAGLAVLGQYAFDAVAGDRLHDVHTADAVPDPREPAISFTTGLFDFAPLRGVITDSHFRQRDRFGRLAVFLALLGWQRGEDVRGIGLDARSALVVDRNGVASLLLQGLGGRALFVRAGKIERMQAGRPFVVRGLDVILLDRAGSKFDLRRWCGDGREYSVDVDGDAKVIYAPANPYVAPQGSRSAACRG